MQEHIIISRSSREETIRRGPWICSRIYRRCNLFLLSCLFNLSVPHHLHFNLPSTGRVNVLSESICRWKEDRDWIFMGYIIDFDACSLPLVFGLVLEDSLSHLPEACRWHCCTIAHCSHLMSSRIIRRKRRKWGKKKYSEAPERKRKGNVGCWWSRSLSYFKTCLSQKISS